MLTRLLMLITLGAGSTVLLASAWPDPATSNAQTSDLSFVSQSVPLDADLLGDGLDAAQLLAKALDQLDAGKVSWLRTTIRQTMRDPQCTYVAEGSLTRGPNQCVRLDMKVGRQRMTIVSDGQVLAHVHNDGADPVRIEQMPTDAAEREAFLNARGCGGPASILRHIQPLAKDARLQTGLLGEVPVIRISFNVPAEQPSGCAPTTIPARRGQLYLDAKTLWPCCVEWWGHNQVDEMCLILRLEFPDAEVNRRLTDAECVRLFSCN